MKFFFSSFSHRGAVAFLALVGFWPALHSDISQRAAEWEAEHSAQAAEGEPILPDAEALARRNGPFRTDASQGIPAGVKARGSPADDWLKPEPRAPERSRDTVLVKMRPSPKPLPGQPRTMAEETPGAAIDRILGNKAVAEVSQLVKPDAATNGPAAMSGKSSDFASQRARIAEKARERGLDRWHRVRLADETSADEAIDLLTTDEAVEAAEPDFLFHLSSLPSPDSKSSAEPSTLDASASSFSTSSLPAAETDPRFADQWHLEASGVPDAWEHLESLDLPPGGSRDVIVAVIDTGVDYTHPDLAANMWINSREEADGSDTDDNGYRDDIHGIDTTAGSAAQKGDPIDDHGHGTHVAGIIAAQAGNNQGGVGVAFNTRIMAIKAAQYSGVLTSSHIGEGIYYAVENGADVINMSFGGYGQSQLVEDALAVAFGQAVLVAAAGNDGRTNLPDCDPLNYGAMYPAAYNWVLGVMASDPSGSLAGFSNWDCIPGDTVEYELMAPGSGIVSTLPNEGYSGWAGTSMATPVVAGTAALLRTKWADKQSHSSRFIMGQLASTGPMMHGRTDSVTGEVWNYAAIDALAALTDVPSPELSYLEHWLFDTADIHADNDDDGIVDAGETVELAIVLRNHWGRADNVTATLEARADGAVGPDPFVTMDTDTVEYGSIGSFNQKDNGFIRDDEGAITGVDNPFRFSVASDTPNDHIIPFRLTITADNGLDAEDGTTYSSTANFYLVVQKGRQLPPIIEEDMVLEKDTYWIVDRPVLIPEGVTVNVTEGATIQFWSSDPQKVYSTGQAPFLQVEGTFDVKGTQEEPAHLVVSELYPTQFLTVRVPHERADLEGSDVSIKYADVTNPSLGERHYSGNRKLKSISHTIFRQRDAMYRPTIMAREFLKSRLLKLGTSESSYPHSSALLIGDVHYSLFDSVIVQSRKDLSESVIRSASGNVFLKNVQSYRDTFDQVSRAFTWGAYSRLEFRNVSDDNGYTNFSVYSDYYNIVDYNQSWAKGFVEYLGGIWRITNDEENELLSYAHFQLQLSLVSKADGSEVWEWSDGTPAEYFNWIDGHPRQGDRYAFVSDGGWTSRPSSSTWAWFFVPGEWTEDELIAARDAYFASEHFKPGRGSFHSNAILNLWHDPDPMHWMRFFSGPPTASTSGTGDFYLLSHNYWGTTSRALINAAIFDYNDNFNLPEIVYEPILETPSVETYPFVVDVQLDTDGNSDVESVGAEEVTFSVSFNRDMDPDVHPQVSFGPSGPWTDFRVQPLDGGWADARTWKGTARITPLTGDGWQYMRVAGAVAADDPWLITGDDSERFRFQVNTSGVEAMNLFAEGGEGGVDLSWMQDDFEMLAGFNLYRATSPTGSFNRVNAHLIPHEQKSYRDTDVQPGQTYYYQFTVVKTDFTESSPSNTATATPLDTIAPVITHTPLTSGSPNLSLTIAADATDNVAVESVNLFFRQTGAETYTQRAMINTTGNRYSATLSGSEVTTPGVDYYIEVSDGVGITRSGRAEAPHPIAVVDSPVITTISPSRGPAEGGTAVTISGSNFKEDATVRFGDLGGMDVNVESETQIAAVTPPHFPTAVDVKVTNPSDESDALLNAFAYESDAVQISLPTITGGRDSFIEIPLQIDNADGVAALDIEIHFDPDVLRTADVRLGSLTSNWSLAANTETDGEIRLSMASPGGTISGSGTLAILELEVTGEPEANTDLTIDSATLNDGAITTESGDGSFTVDATYSLTGAIHFWKDNQPIEGAALTLTGERDFSQTTDADGAFTIQGIDAGPYELQPEKSDQVAGISALDASLILKHAAGLETLTDHAATAADVNLSGQVNAMDAYLVLQNAVGLIDDPFPGAGKVWSFSPDDHTYSDLSSNLTNQDFTAILLGDVSGNWNADESTPQTMEPSGASIVLHEIPVPDTDEIIARVLLANGEPVIESIELTLTHGTAVTLENAIPGKLLEGFSHALNTEQSNQTRAAMAGTEPLSGDDVLLTLHFRGEGPTSLNLDRYVIQEGAYSLTLSADLSPFDTDGDGLIDIDEIEIFESDPENPDTTGDGIPDGLAHRLGLNPADPASRFTITDFDGAPQDDLHITWPTKPGNTYQIESSSNLTDWEPHGDPIVADGDTATVSLPRGDETQRFYRVVFEAK